MTDQDIFFMREAISQAKLAADETEVPVGAVIVKDGKIISVGRNRRELGKNALYHAETEAIDLACKALGGWRLPGVTLYVTMEPCAMCAGAIINARVERVVYGARDLRFGAFGSLIDLAKVPLNHTPEIVPDVLGDEAREILSTYFRGKREKSKKEKTDLL